MTQNPQAKKSKVTTQLNNEPTFINGSQLNSSVSKMQYSIPKAKRFAQDRPLDISAKFYDIPDTKTLRSASLGYGNKMDLSKQYFEKPSPGHYQIKSEFDTSNKKKGITISAGREIIKNNSCFQVKKNIPGPGQYNPKSAEFNQQDAKKGFSLASRNKDLSNKWIESVPGPGKYQTLQILDKNLKSNNSRIRTIQTSKFSKQMRKSQFEQRIKQNIPGPGQYPKYDNLDNTAKFAHNNGFRFSHSQRQGIVQKNKIAIPGPGSYPYFSDFVRKQ